jgi:hypothetical protein
VKNQRDLAAQSMTIANKNHHNYYFSVFIQRFGAKAEVYTAVIIVLVYTDSHDTMATTVQTQL